MGDEVKTKVLRLELLADQVHLFRSIQKVLNHDEPEQTFEKMVQLIQAAILLTSREQPKVRLHTRDFSKVVSHIVVCPQCSCQFTPPVSLEDDGFRETVVDLS